MIKKKRVVKSRVPKTRNNDTMTESMFWSFIRSALRQKSRWWKPIASIKAKAKRPYIGSLKRQKFEYQCNHCKKWFPDKKVSVDHIKSVGTLTCAYDLPDFVERLFCLEENLQVLCEACHSIKTKNERITNKSK